MLCDNVLVCICWEGKIICYLFDSLVVVVVMGVLYE